MTFRTAGALGVVFYYTGPGEKSGFQKIASAVRDDMKKKLPNDAALFGPAK